MFSVTRLTWAYLPGHARARGSKVADHVARNAIAKAIITIDKTGWILWTRNFAVKTRMHVDNIYQQRMKEGVERRGEEESKVVGWYSSTLPKPTADCHN